jgi:cell division protein FtsZ
MSPFEFDLPKDQASIIKVIGVGGGGGNAVNHMYQEGIEGVNFVVCNTDAQALQTSPVPNKIQLGPSLTQGLGAGANPEVGMQACEESIEEIRTLLGKNTKMVFITAGMGGGTGTGAAPVVARIAREMGILTVAIVTTPFSFEGRKRHSHAMDGIQKLKEQVDTILVIGNDKIRTMYGNLTQSQAFSHANNILTTAAKSISEIITTPGFINVDFADVKTVMQNGGAAIMGCAFAEGELRAKLAVEAALNSPLLNDNQIRGAKNVLVNISSGAAEVTMDEFEEINDYIQSAANDTDIIFGSSRDMSLENKLMVTVIATGFEARLETQYAPVQKVKVYDLDKQLEKVTVPEKTVAPVVENNTGKVVYSLEETELTIVEDTVVNSTEIIEENASVVEVVTNTNDTSLINPADDDFVISTLVNDEENDFDLFSGFSATDVSENTIEFELELESSLINETNESVADEEMLNASTEQNILEQQPLEEYNSQETEEKNQESEPFIVFKRSYDEPVAETATEASKELDHRKQMLQQLSRNSMKKNLAELENTPAYERAGKTIINNHVSENNLSLSRYSVTETGTEFSQPGIQNDNKFLHDKAD